MGAEGFEGVEGTGAEGIGAVVGRAGGTDAKTERAGVGGSSVCSETGSCGWGEFQKLGRGRWNENEGKSVYIGRWGM